jgi:polyhydroxyalkanoate synthesis repressor PhaR
VKRPIILKKYGNRRLYDSRKSGYVTLVEVEQMIADGEEVQVIDAKSGDDLTKSVLVQIILEREDSREALPTSFLKEVIRVGKTPMRDTFKRNLQGMLDGFLDAQRAVIGAQSTLGQQMAQMAQMAPSMLANPFAAFAPTPQRAPAPPPPAQNDQELRQLRQELSETQSLVRELITAQNRALATAQEPEPEAEEATPRPRTRRKKAASKARPRRKRSSS